MIHFVSVYNIVRKSAGMQRGKLFGNTSADPGTDAECNFVTFRLLVDAL